MEYFIKFLISFNLIIYLKMTINLFFIVTIVLLILLIILGIILLDLAKKNQNVNSKKYLNWAGGLACAFFAIYAFIFIIFRFFYYPEIALAVRGATGESPNSISKICDSKNIGSMGGISKYCSQFIFYEKLFLSPLVIIFLIIGILCVFVAMDLSKSDNFKNDVNQHAYKVSILISVLSFVGITILIFSMIHKPK
jgi:hypothetical protein